MNLYKVKNTEYFKNKYKYKIITVELITNAASTKKRILKA